MPKKLPTSSPRRRRKRQQRVGLSAIAQRLGVSMMTVSAALNGKPGVSEATRQRIQTVADELRYRPNKLVLAIRSGRSGVIGVMISPSSDFAGAVVRGIHDELVANGSLPLLHFHGGGPVAEPDTDELAYIHRLLDQRVDGIILWPSDESVPDLYLREVWERGIPLVCVDRQLSFTHADFVGTDDEIGGRLAAEHLLGLGHRRLVHLGGQRIVGTYEGRREGFERAVAQCRGGQCVTVEAHLDDLATAAREVLAHKPTAVFAASDVMVPPLYEAARAAGLSLPRDLSIVGFADLAIASVMWPPLTTLRQDAMEMGRQAARAMLRRLDGSVPIGDQPVSLRLPPKLIIRGSTTAAFPESTSV